DTTSSSSYADKTVLPSSSYMYAVDAFDAAGNHSAQSTSVTAHTRGAFSTPIRHIVIIDEENRSFNEILGKFCTEQAAGQIQRAGANDPCAGTTQGVLSDGTPYALTSEPDVQPDIGHMASYQ